MSRRHDRHYPLFGREGQERLRSMTVAVVGVGGNGSHVTQQLAYLGVGGLGLIDDEELSETNLGRYVTAHHDDAMTTSPKTHLGERLISRIDPTIEVTTIQETLASSAAFQFIQAADAVFGCLDDDGPRFVLNELCCAFERPYFDLASGIPTDRDYGGRLTSVVDDGGCLYCFGQLDMAEVEAFIANPEQRAARDGAYGVPLDELGGSGPSVISINGVIASLAVTEFMNWATGLRAPRRRLMYRGNRAIVTVPTDAALHDCYYCKGIRGHRDAAGLDRYLRGQEPAP